MDRYVVRVEVLGRLREQLRVRGKALQLVQRVQVELGRGQVRWRRSLLQPLQVQTAVTVEEGVGVVMASQHSLVEPGIVRALLVLTLILLDRAVVLV